MRKHFQKILPRNMKLRSVFFIQKSKKKYNDKKFKKYDFFEYCLIITINFSKRF